MANRARDLPPLPPIEDPSDLDPWQCRKLWVASLAVKLNILLGGPDPALAQQKPPSREAERRRLLEWLGSPAFHAECELAGIDGDYLLWRMATDGVDPVCLTGFTVHPSGRRGPKVAA